MVDRDSATFGGVNRVMNPSTPEEPNTDAQCPVPTVEPFEPFPSLFDHQPAVENSRLCAEPSPPFRSRAVPMPFLLQRSWIGVGVWLGAMTVVGLAAIVFGATAADFATGPGPAGAGETDETSIGSSSAGGSGTLVDGHRASRSRTAGGSTDDAAPAGADRGETERTVGPSYGRDLDRDLDLRSPAASTASTGSVDGVPATSTVGSGLATGREAASVDESSEPGPESATSTTAVPPVVIRPPIDEAPTSRPGTVGPASGTPGTPTVPTTSAAPRRPTTPIGPPVGVEPPTTRKPAPGDTRPSIGGGRARNAPSFAGSGSGASIGGPVGRRP